MPDVEQADLTALTVQLLSAYVSNNMVPSENLAGLIETTRSALAGKTEPAAEPAAEFFTPAVTVRKSLGSKDHILSLIDGKPYKTLKRHLSNNGLTPKEYRERYGLSKDYPMVAPNYSEHRRAVAQMLGLGRRPIVKAAEVPLVEEAVAPVEPVAKTPTKAPRVVKAKVVPKAAAKATKSAPSKAAPAAEIPAEVTPNIEATAPKPRGRKPKVAAAPVATPKRARKKVEAPAPLAEAFPKRTRKPKAAAEAA